MINGLGSLPSQRLKVCGKNYVQSTKSGKVMTKMKYIFFYHEPCTQYLNIGMAQITRAEH